MKTRNLTYNSIIKKVIKESLDDNLQWIKDVEPSRLVLDKEDEYNIMYDYVSKFGLNYDGWELYIDNMSGTWQLTNPQFQDIIIYASPQWEDEDIVPVAYDDVDDYRDLGEIEIPKLEFEFQVIDWLNNVYIKEVINKFYNFF